MNPAMAMAMAMNGTDNAGMAPVATPWFFYSLAGLAVLSGVLVITRRNAVHSALALIVTLLSVAGLYLMLYAPFVAGVQIIVYAGGIMVLFLFVIMLVNLDRSSKERQFQSYLAGRIDGGLRFAGVVRVGDCEGQGSVS